jgi:putative endonuclease
MHYVYILYSPSDDKYYVGSSSNPEGRLLAHNHPQNKGWTKRFQPWELVFSQAFDSKPATGGGENKILQKQNNDPF